MSIVYWCLHIWGDSIQAACSGNGQANFDKEFETMIDNGRETLQELWCHQRKVLLPLGSSGSVGNLVSAPQSYDMTVESSVYDTLESYVNS